MASTDKQKQSLYFPEDMLREISHEATRLDRSLSWTVQQAWRLARAELRNFPSIAHRDVVRERPRETEERTETAERAEVVETREPSAQVREFLRGKFDCEVAS
jgi:uncharacterized small protein (TIGR04563 family)